MGREEEGFFFTFSVMFLKLICVLFIIFQRFLGPLTISGIVLFVALFNGFRPWTNVGKISVLDVMGIYYIRFRKFVFFFSFNFINFSVNIIFINVFCIFVFL